MLYLAAHLFAEKLTEHCCVQHLLLGKGLHTKDSDQRTNAEVSHALFHGEHLARLGHGKGQ